MFPFFKKFFFGYGLFQVKRVGYGKGRKRTCWAMEIIENFWFGLTGYKIWSYKAREKETHAKNTLKRVGKQKEVEVFHRTLKVHFEKPEPTFVLNTLTHPNRSLTTHERRPEWFEDQMRKVYLTLKLRKLPEIGNTKLSIQVTVPPKPHDYGLHEVRSDYIPGPESWRKIVIKAPIKTVISDRPNPTAFPRLGEVETCNCWFQGAAVKLHPKLITMIVGLGYPPDLYRVMGVFGDKIYYLLQNDESTRTLLIDGSVCIVQTCHLIQSDDPFIGHNLSNKTTKWVGAKIDHVESGSLKYQPKRLIQPIPQVELVGSQEWISAYVPYCSFYSSELIKTTKTTPPTKYWNEYERALGLFKQPVFNTSDVTMKKMRHEEVPSWLKRRVKAFERSLDRAGRYFGAKILNDKSFECATYQEWQELEMQRYEIARTLYSTSESSLSSSAKLYLKSANAKHWLNSIALTYCTHIGQANLQMKTFNDYFVSVHGGKPLEIPKHLIISHKKLMDDQESNKARQLAAREEAKTHDQSVLASRALTAREKRDALLGRTSTDKKKRQMPVSFDTEDDSLPDISEWRLSSPQVSV